MIANYLKWSRLEEWKMLVSRLLYLGLVAVSEAL